MDVRPRVFNDQVDPSNTGAYVVYADTPFGANHNLALARLNSDHKSGTYLGKIQFAPGDALTGHSGLGHYNEGPDIVTMQMPGRAARSFYYLFFSSAVDGGNDDTGWTGYAMCTAATFHQQPDELLEVQGLNLPEPAHGALESSQLDRVQGQLLRVLSQGSSRLLQPGEESRPPGVRAQNSTGGSSSVLPTTARSSA